MKYRYESVNNLHEDKLKCLDRKTLEDKWFKKNKLFFCL